MFDRKQSFKIFVGILLKAVSYFISITSHIILTTVSNYG